MTSAGGYQFWDRCLLQHARFGDVDILVLPESTAAASDRLCEAGWLAKRGESPEIVGRKSQVRIGTDYRKGEFGWIDLHRHVFHFSRRDRELDAALWENARTARLGGRPILIPSPADSIVISITHGVRSGDGDWAIDVAYRIRASQIAWDKVAYIADRRGLVPYILSGLTYLRTLGVDVPQSVLDCLHAKRPTTGEYLKYWVETLRREGVPNRVRKAVNRIAKMLFPTLLPPDRYEYRLKSRH
jgi:hypothetical protein